MLVLSSCYKLNPSGSKNLFIGLETETFKPVVCIGSATEGVILSAEETLRLLDDLRFTDLNHFRGEHSETRAESLSEKHDIIYTVYKENPVIVLSSSKNAVYLGRVTWEAFVRHGFLIRIKLQQLEQCSAKAEKWIQDFVQRISVLEGAGTLGALTDSEKVNVLRFINHNCFISRWRHVLQTEYIEKHGNPLQINFLLDMCTVSTVYVEDALLKCRVSPSDYVLATIINS